MKHEYFKISYRRVKECMEHLAFFGILWFLLNEHLVQITNFLNTIGVYSSFDLVLIITLLMLALFLVYAVGAGLVQFAYWFFGWQTGQSKWYPNLTEHEIKVSITKGDYWKIREHQKFTYKYPGEVKAIFRFDKLEDWATQVVNKEIDKLVKEKKR